MKNISINFTPKGNCIVQPKNMPAVEIPKEEAVPVHDCAEALYQNYQRRISNAYENERRILGNTLWNWRGVTIKNYTLEIQEKLKLLASSQPFNLNTYTRGA